MAEKKERVAEARAKQQTFYDQRHESYERKIEQARKGKRVISGKAIPFQQNRHGLIRYYVREGAPDLAALATDNFFLFVNEIRSHGSRHVHQGGITLFVLKGRGYSVVDGVRHDWEAGDLIMLPIKKGGCDHQHFNLDNKPSRWLALRHKPLREIVGQFREQKEEHPDWKE